MTQTMESPSNRQPIELDDEVEEIQSKGLMSRLTKVSEQIASTAIGQYGIKKLDNFLWIVEKTAKWSLPQNMRLNTSSSTIRDEGDDEQEKIPPPPLTRPLPWLLFIPMLITLRMVRTGFSLVALMCGRSPVTPSVMVSFIQSRRRKLRAIKYSGLRTIRIRFIEAAEQRKNGKISRVNLLSRLSNLFGLLLCGNYGNTVRPVKVTVKKEKKTPGSERKKRHVDESDDDENELGCNELLDKLADEVDSNDSSFGSEAVTTSDITISDDESETDNILNKTMNEKDTPKYATPKYRKSRSHPNSGSSAPASEAVNSEALQFMSTPKRSQSHSVMTNNVPEEPRMKNGENGHSNLNEIKKSPVKVHVHLNGAANNRAVAHRPNRQSIEYYKNVANEMVIHEDEQYYNHVNGTPKEVENNEIPEPINNLPEAQRNEAPQMVVNNPHQSNNTNPNVHPINVPKNPDRSHGGRGKHQKRRNNSQNNRRNGNSAQPK